jgi:hypothetical protein
MVPLYGFTSMIEPSAFLAIFPYAFIAAFPILGVVLVTKWELSARKRRKQSQNNKNRDPMAR